MKNVILRFSIKYAFVWCELESIVTFPITKRMISLCSHIDASLDLKAPALSYLIVWF